MKYAGYCAIGATLVLQISLTCAKHGNSHLNALEHRHNHKRELRASVAQTGTNLEVREAEVEKRSGQCQFPSDAGLVAVTPNDQNGGWAMSPNQCCDPGHYCPYACPPGQVMAQWDPEATTYTYPQSMNGGLYCDNDGNIQKPFPNKPYCMDGSGNIGCTNKASGNVAFCQTVLPGNEAMLIPTNIETWAQLAVPGPSYWAGTAAHFYINPPGVSTEEACVWGSSSNPYGNWSPYVAGANTVESGETFIKLAWNPIYLEPATPFRNEMPTWGVEIVCDGDCNGLPCAIDPSKHQVNEMDGSNTDGAGGANFCVVTVPKGATANFVVFEGGMSGGDTGSGGAPQSPANPSTPYSSSAAPPPPPPSSSSSSTPEPSPTPIPTPSPSLTPTPTPIPTSTPTPTPTPTSASSLLSPTPASSSSSTPPPSSSSSYPLSSSNSAPPPSSSPASSSSVIVTVNSVAAPNVTTNSPTTYSYVHSQQSAGPSHLSFHYKPHVFVENATSSTSVASASGSSNGTTTPSQSLVLQSAKPTGAGYNMQVTIGGFGLTVLAAIAVVAL